jgi:5-methylcytosine-specific restriction endonuclease McrA
LKTRRRNASALLFVTEILENIMKKHTKIYFQAMGISPVEFLGCEVCGRRAVDIHHIEPRGMGGSKTRDVIENLMALCRECHHEADFGVELSKDFLKAVHLKKIPQ